jgi:hypothetical protein
MTKNEATEFKQLFKACCEVTGRTLSDTVLAIYIQSFNKTEFHGIKRVMMEFIKCGKFPTINDILSRIGEKDISPEERARILSQEVITAIGKFGWCNEREAKEHFGPDWDIITGFQGWGLLCNITNDDLSIFSAQFRQYAEIIYKRRDVEKNTGLALGEGMTIDSRVKSIADDQIKKLAAATDRT